MRNVNGCYLGYTLRMGDNADLGIQSKLGIVADGRSVFLKSLIKYW